MTVRSDAFDLLLAQDHSHSGQMALQPRYSIFVASLCSATFHNLIIIEPGKFWWHAA